MEKETFERKWLLGITQGNSPTLESRNINSKEKIMSSEFPETELIVSIAEDVEKLSSLLGPKYHLDIKTALSCVELYKSTFGDEGFSALEKEVNFLGKYIYEKPEAEGLQQIHKFQSKLELLKTFQFTNYYDKKAYQSFIKSEKEEIAAFADKSSLEKINDHFEKNSTIDPNGTLRVKGWAELNRKLNEGKPFFGDILEFALTHDHLPTDAEIAKMPKQGHSPPLERRNINIKENFMSEEIEENEEKNFTPQQLAFMNAAHQRKVIADAVKAGSLCCLPGKDGYADTSPAFNIMSPDKPYHGANLLYLKEHQKQNGFPTAEYVTAFQIDEAKRDNPNLIIEKGQKGVSIHVSERSQETGEWNEKHIRLFNVAQVNKPNLLKNWAEQKLEEKAQERLEYLQTQHGTGWKPSEPREKMPAPEVIVCSSTEPEKYLGQYLAAVSMGSKFKASPEQATEFSEKMINTLYEQMKPRTDPVTGDLKQPPLNKQTGEPLTNVFSLEEISRGANKECKEFMTNLRINAQKQNQPEQKQEQQQSIGGMKR